MERATAGLNNRAQAEETPLRAPALSQRAPSQILSNVDSKHSKPHFRSATSIGKSDLHCWDSAENTHCQDKQ